MKVSQVPWRSLDASNARSSIRDGCRAVAPGYAPGLSRTANLRPISSGCETGRGFEGWVDAACGGHLIKL